jgi:hypothetical protein
MSSAIWQREFEDTASQAEILADAKIYPALVINWRGSG